MCNGFPLRNNLKGRMYMNYTQNYHLPQWVKEDRIMMEDFNAMNSSIENGLTQTAAQAGTAVSTANTAKQTADTAQTMAQKITSAAYTPSNKPYKVGSYTGNDKAQTINVGFRPSFLIISGAIVDAPGNTPTFFTNYTCITAGNVLSSRVTFTDNGFTVTGVGGSPNLSWSGRAYDYIAFK